MKMITFNLSNPLKYAHNNAEKETEFIELREPTGKVSYICCEIESAIQSGILKMAGALDESIMEEAKEEARNKAQNKEDGDESDQTMDSASVLNIMASGGVDMKKVVISFRELFKDVAFMGGEKQITIPRMNEMPHPDFRRMMGVYAANFILNLQ